MEWASLQWWCVLGVCLVATAAASSPSPSGQEECEVLRTTPCSFKSSTNTITVKPKAFVWTLEFVLQGEDSWHSLCVRVENNHTVYTTALHLGNCRTGSLMDVAYVTHSSTLYSPVQPHVWTTLDVEARSNAVLVTAPNRPITLRTIADQSLPVTLRVMKKNHVEAAVGCYDNCPFYKYSTESSKTIHTTRHKLFHFYFQAGPTFQQLEHEVICTTNFNNEKHIRFQSIVNISDSNVIQDKWHRVDFENAGSEIKTFLDNFPLAMRDMPEQCTFRKHSLRVVGEVRIKFCTSHKLEEETRDAYRGNASAADKTCHVAVVMLLASTWWWWWWWGYDAQFVHCPGETLHHPRHINYHPHPHSHTPRELSREPARGNSCLLP